MRPPILLLLSLTAFLTVHLPAAAVLPSVVATAKLDNTCQCECCYQITEYQTECLSPNEAFFEVPTCSQCTVSQCSTRFPTPCSQPSSVVTANCEVEHTAFFRLVPALFILATIALLIYGFFFKKFDGYHREQTNPPVVNHQSRHYNTFPNDSATSHPSETTKLLSRHSPKVTTLPTIDEEEETPSEERQQQTTSTQSPTPPQSPRDDPPPPAQQQHVQRSSLPLVQDDVDIDTRASEVATVDSDSTYARDLSVPSEVPQPDPFDADADAPAASHDVRHATEANPSAVSERHASEADQPHSRTPPTDTVEEAVVADRTQHAVSDEQTESFSAPGLSSEAMKADIIDQLDSKLDVGEGDKPTQEDAQTADVEPQSHQQTVNAAKSTEDPETTEFVSQRQTMTEGHSEPGLRDVTDHTSGISPDPVYEATDVGVESSLAPHLTEASPAGEETNTSTLNDPKPALEEALPDLDESPNVLSETAPDTSTVARIITTDDSAAVQSELESTQDSPIPEIPYISKQDQGAEETVETEDQTFTSANEDPSTVDASNDITTEDMQSEPTEPADTTPTSEVQVYPSVEDTARGHAQDVPPEAIETEGRLEEQPAHEEERSISPREEAESLDPNVNTTDAVTEAVPEPVSFPQKDSTTAVETTTATETRPEPVLETSVDEGMVRVQEELGEVPHEDEGEQKHLESVSNLIKNEPNSSEQDAAVVEPIRESEKHPEASVIEEESPFIISGESVSESQEVADSPALIDNSEEAKQTETLPPSEAQKHPPLAVSESPVGDNTTVGEPGMEIPCELDVESQFIKSEEAGTNVSDQQLTHSGSLPEADDVSFEAEQSLTEDAPDDRIAIKEQVPEAEQDVELKVPIPVDEGETLGAKESEPSTALVELEPETMPSQTEETGSPDRATPKDPVLESDLEQTTNDSEAVAHDSHAPKPTLLDSAMPETSGSPTVDEDDDLKVSDPVAAEVTGTGAADDRQEAPQPLQEAEQVTGQKVEASSLESERNVPHDPTQELVHADGTDAGKHEQSASQQEMEQIAHRASTDVDSSTTDTADAEKAVVMENNTVPDLTETENVDRVLSEPEYVEQNLSETHDLSQMKMAPEAELEVIESQLSEHDDVLDAALELLGKDPEVAEATTLEPSRSEPVTAENEFAEGGALDTMSTEPVNVRLRTMESGSVKEAVEREIAGPASLDLEVEARDVPSLQSIEKGTMEAEGIDVLKDTTTTYIEPTDSEAKDPARDGALVDTVSPTVTVPEDVEETVYEAQDSNQEVEAPGAEVDAVLPAGTDPQEVEATVDEAQDSHQDDEENDTATYSALVATKDHVDVEVTNEGAELSHREAEVEMLGASELSVPARTDGETGHSIVTEITGPSSEDHRQEAPQLLEEVEQVAGQKVEASSLESERNVPHDSTQELVHPDDTDAGKHEQSASQQEMEQIAHGRSTDVDSSTTDTTDAEKAVVMENDTVPDLTETENVDRVPSEPEYVEQNLSETHDLSQMKMAPEAELEVIESQLSEHDDVLDAALELLGKDPEVAEATTLEPSRSEPVTAENEFAEGGALDTMSTEPVNVRLRTMESGSVKEAVEREIAGPASLDLEVEARDVPSLQSIEEVRQSAVKSSTKLEDVEVVDRAEKSSDPSFLDTEPHGIPSVEETLPGPDQLGQQESEGPAVRDTSEDDIRPASTKAPEIEVANPVVARQGTTDTEIAKEEAKGGPENIESGSGATNITGSQQDSDELAQVSSYSRADGTEFAEISSADASILMSVVSEGEGNRAEVVDSLEVDSGLLPAGHADATLEETQAFDEKIAMTQVMKEEVAVDQVEDSVMADETRSDELGTSEAAGRQMSEAVAEANEDVSTFKKADEHHTDDASMKELDPVFHEEGHDNTGVDFEAVGDEVETFTPEHVFQSGSGAGVLERNESLVVQISGSPEHSTFSLDGQSEAIEADIEPAGPSSIHLFEGVGQKLDDAPSIAVPLAELEAAEAGASSDLLDINEDKAISDLPAAENKSEEEYVENDASSGTAGAVAEENVEPAHTLAEHRNDEEGPIDLSIPSTNSAVATDGEVDASIVYSEGDSTEAVTPQIVDTSEPTLTDGNTSEVIGDVEQSPENLLHQQKGRNSRTQ